jgi:hypothetical protein
MSDIRGTGNIRTLRDALTLTGMGEKSAKVCTFHGWWHFFPPHPHYGRRGFLSPLTA